MDATMMHEPLGTATIMAHGERIHANSRIGLFDGEQVTWRSYAETAERARRLAAALQAAGVGPNTRVATLSWNDFAHFEAYLAVPAMGAVLHTLNLRLHPDQLRYIIADAEDAFLIADGSLLAGLLPQMNASDKLVRIIVTGDTTGLAELEKPWTPYEAFVAEHAPLADFPVPDEAAAAATCYTSGTTGDPKGVVYSHRSVFLHSMAACTGNALAIAEADRVLPVVPMFHASAWGLPYASLMAGADLLMPDRYLQAAPLADMIQQHRPTKAGAVPTIWNDLLQYGIANPGVDLSSIDLVACGGAPVPQSLIEGFADRFGVQIIQAWGMTETSPLAAVGRPPAGISPAKEISYRKRQGRAICGVEMRLIDEGGLPVPRDDKSVGELEVRGPWVTGSYYRLEDTERFRDGWLRTGDVGHISPDGYLTLTDRSKDVIKSGGEWISSVELENWIMSHPDVAEAAVVAMPDPRWQETALAVVVPAPGREVSADTLHEWCLRNCPEEIPHWWIPNNWTFMEQIPRTSVGKFDKKVLRAKHEQGELPVVSN